jgi:predicted N-acetyltransferase YhbS
VSIHVRPYRPSDLEAVERITCAAYGHPMSPGMEARLWIDAGNALLGERDGVAAGFVMASNYGGVAYVASMGVDPAHQRYGIARAMMARLVEDLERDGIAAMLLDATDDGAPLYESFGFADTDRTGVFERPAGPETVSGDFPIGAHELARALELDRAACGCDRSAVLRGFARERLAFLALRPDGYLMAREGSLGPFVAFGVQTARSLLEEALTARLSARRLFIPESNTAAAELAQAYGFSRSRSLRHMERGRSPFARERIFGQASLGHG